jgi:4-amino-4-deoxy-L-arabinose transferase-like glycosyltransferase
MLSGPPLYRSARTSAWFYLFAFVLAVFPLFVHLGSFPIQIWDESRLALNAQEMYFNHNFLVTYCYGSPELWNTKPPLMIWAQVLSMKMFGINELAIRLPSAISGMLTVLLLMWFALRVFKNGWIGLIAILFLITSVGFVGMHITRTGDYDAMMILFTTAYCLFWYLYLQEKKGKFIYYFFITLTLAILTKSIAGVLFVPGIFIYTWMTERSLRIFFTRKVVIGSILSLLLISTYYLIREWAAPGYLKAVWENEIGGRYFSVIEYHQQKWDYFLQGLWEYFPEGIVMTLAGFIFFLRKKSNPFFRFGFYILLISSLHLITISCSQTKLIHYVSPEIPLLALIGGLFVYQCIDFLLHRINKSAALYFGIVVGLLFILPYKNIMHAVIYPFDKKEQDFNQLAGMLSSAYHNQDTLLRNFVILHEGYEPQLDFYVNILTKEGFPIRWKYRRDLISGEKVVVRSEESRTDLQKYFHVQVLGDYGIVRLVKIQSD